MKIFLKWIFTTLLTVVVIDLAIGSLFDNYMKRHGLRGDYVAIDHVLRNNNSDILVIGSSVALTDINTKTMEDSLGIKTYNGGGNGQYFPFFITMLKSAVSVDKPKHVILCVTPSAFVNQGLGPRYNIFAPYYGLRIADIDENINEMHRHNRQLMHLSSYKLNQIWFRIFLYNFLTPEINDENGHIVKNLPPIFPRKNKEATGLFNNERKKQFVDFMNICRDNGIELTIVFAPLYTDFEHDDGPGLLITDEVRELAKQYGFEVYDDIRMRPFATDSTLFYDNDHLNIKGSQIYTDSIISRYLHKKDR